MSEQREKYRSDVKLTDVDTCEVFYDKLTFIYLEMPKFNKTVDELNTRFEKWLYVIRNLNRLDRIPDKLKESIFEKLFQVAEIAKFSKEELNLYEDSLRYYRDLNNSLDLAQEEGENKKARQVILNGKRRNMSVDILAELTGLTIAEETQIWAEV